MENLTITLNPEQGTFLLESLDWSIQAAERSLQRNEHNAQAREKWTQLDDLIAQIQEAKRAWYAPST